MTFTEGLPEPVTRLLLSSMTSQFATLTKAGVPIDTPMFCFPNDELTSIDVGTGMTYPAKAERARRNPKAGMLVEGSDDEPVVAITGMAAVEDADVQANTERYISETGMFRVGNVPWATARPALWYWSRIIVRVQPVRILWWDTPAAMDGAPQEWRAPADTAYAASDPAPPGTISASSKWPVRPWSEAFASAVEGGRRAHVSVCDAEGFPVPIPVQPLGATDEGIRLEVPAGAPWRGGPACLTFEGREAFVGEVVEADGGTLLRVERALPMSPLVNDPNSLWDPPEKVRESMMRRLHHETERRGVPIPIIPETDPVPTAGAKRRVERAAQGSRMDRYADS